MTSSNLVICGVDEAGRGSLISDIYSASVIIPEWFDKKLLQEDKIIIRDSKKMTEKQRQKARIYIEKNCVAFGIGINNHEEIDKKNIRNATIDAMNLSLKNLQFQSDEKRLPDKVLIDGDFFVNKTEWEHPCVFETIVDGDNLHSVISCASILAKTHRDESIYKLVGENPDLQDKYLIGNNKGYGTKVHLLGLEKFGISPYHRKSFCRKYYNYRLLL